jgi:hypothetical protein|tara:strand:- start:8438 stop:9376 length:939 start_codon:yes stop_codon:yes gene_type:complete
MKWFLDEKYPKATQDISHGEGIVFIGSCFSENIFNRGKQLGFDFRSTNYGTIFHPLPIARIIQDAIHLNPDFRIDSNEGRYFSWDTSSKMVAESKNELEKRLSEEQSKLHKNLKSAKYLFLTFGTAKEYVMSDGLVVANCHKVPSSEFNSQLSEVQELVKTYENLLSDLSNFNPELKIVVTVSPVRHSKDGLVENNRSKARLIQLCELLEKKVSVNYFPAYELVIDQLRDYRFYSKDLVHPSDEAIEFVWEKFQETYFSEETARICNQIGKFKSYFGHRPLRKENERELEIRQSKQSELKAFLAKNPQVIWQ